ncbi:TonB-dependent receptor [Paracoccus sp. (in: a-proteobacteria)]|uniref:TonB-dependent receptor n=1 Tax=Paracoccus sp. TaxID=267 RepID=UPI002AFE1E7C|nr:TonB-dependent receptor [Paracoccus sp. (in: a-proteobacteria)]
MRLRKIKRLLCSTCAVGALCFTPLSVVGQNAPANVIVLEEIMLRGEGVTRSLSDTASSVAVISAQDIEANQSSDSVQKAIEAVPNVTFTGTTGAPMIRGQDSQGPNSGAGAFFSGTIPRATINVDGRYVSYNEYANGAESSWDVAGIEVFRGPQTTSQGANSIAGAIIVHTADPTFAPEGAVQLQYGSNAHRRASLAYSAPISDDLAARVALDYSARDTFIDYINPNFAKGESDQDFESRTARFKFLWRPSDLPGFEAKLTLQHSQTNRPTIEAAFEPFEDLNSVAATMPSLLLRTNSAVLDVSHDFGSGLTLSNQLQYSDLSSRRMIEPMTEGGATIDTISVSNETRLLFGEAGRPGISGVAGLYMSRNDSDETLLLRGSSYFEDQKDSFGLYSELTWRTDSPWSVTGGLRYQRDRVQRSGTSSYAQGALDYDQTFDAWLPKLSVAYDMTDRTTVGALVNRGYNPGGVSLNFQTGQYVPFDAEKVWNYELFGRTSVLEDRLILTGNLFYSDFSNAQRYVQVSIPENVGQSLTVNAERAKSYGLEVAMDYQARDNLRLRGGIGLLHTEITGFRNALADFEGKQFSRAPAYTFSLGADWNITPQMRLSGDLRHTDGYFSDDENTPAYEIGSYTIANARLTYTTQRGMELFAYANNIFDERKPIYMRINRSVGGIEAAMPEPRTVGIGLMHRF